MFNCTNCGKANEPTAIFCSSCRERIDYSNIVARKKEQTNVRTITSSKISAGAVLVNLYFTILIIAFTIGAAKLLWDSRVIFEQLLSYFSNEPPPIRVIRGDLQNPVPLFICPLFLGVILIVSTLLKLCHKAQVGWFCLLVILLILLCPTLISAYLINEFAKEVPEIIWVIGLLPSCYQLLYFFMLCIFLFRVIKIPGILIISLIIFLFIQPPDNILGIFIFSIFINLCCAWKFAKAFGGGPRTAIMLIICPLTPVVIACSKRYQYQYYP